MTPKQPPEIPTWILKHFGCGPNNAVLLGDLAEQYQHNGSAVWFWRQSLKAIPVSLFNEVRAHKGIAARSLLMGWGLWALFISIFPLITPYFFGGGFGVYIERRDPIGTLWTVLSAPVGVQASLGRPFSFVFAVVLPLFVWTMCGWLVARFHRGQQTGVVLLFAGSILLSYMLLFGRFVFFVRPPAPWLYAFSGQFAAYAVASVLGILLGGGLLRGRSTVVNN
jgi:hypothetical protein